MAKGFEEPDLRNFILTSFFMKGEAIDLSPREAKEIYDGKKGLNFFNYTREKRVYKYSVDNEYLVQSILAGYFIYARKIVINDEIEEYIKSICS